MGGAGVLWNLCSVVVLMWSITTRTLTQFGSELLSVVCCRDGCYISKGYDPTTHFETTVDDVLDIYKRITGKDLDLDSKDPRLAEQQQDM